MSSITTTSAIPPLESVILSRKVTRNSEGQLEQQSVRKESGRVFHRDLDIAISECSTLYGEGNFRDFPDEVQQILVNMMFNMGRPRLSKFKKMNVALQKHDWVEAAKEGRDSRWYRQVTNRAERLMTRLENIS